MRKLGDGNEGFTLAELLIVVAIIGVLTAISIPVFTGQLEKSRESVDLANLRSAYSEIMTAVIMEDAGNYSREVELKQKQDDWNAFDPVTVGGIKHAKSEGDTEHWIGIPVEKGKCELSYIPDFGMKVVWIGPDGNGTSSSFAYSGDVHSVLSNTDILETLRNQNNINFEIDSKCPNSTMIPKIDEEIKKEGNSILATGTWAYMGNSKEDSQRYFFWTSMDTTEVGSGKTIPVIVSKASGGFFVSESTTATRTKDGKNYVAIAARVGNAKNLAKYETGKEYATLEEAYKAYEELLKDGNYPK